MLSSKTRQIRSKNIINKNKYYAEISLDSNTYPVTIFAESTKQAKRLLHSNYKFDHINYISDKKHHKYHKGKAANSAVTPHISYFSGNKTTKAYTVMEV